MDQPGTGVSDRTYKCADGYWSADGGVSGACTAVSVCDTHATKTVDETLTSDAVCSCNAEVMEACAATSVGTDDQACSDADISGDAAASQSACEGAGACTYTAGVPGYWGAGLAGLCTEHQLCTAAQYETQAANSTDDRICAPLTTCAVGAEYESVPATATSDKQCRPLTVCAGDVAEACAATSAGTDDAACAAADISGDATASQSACEGAGACTYTPAQAATQYMSQSYNATRDRTCAPITNCNTAVVAEACAATSAGTDDAACAAADISGDATASQSACEGAGACTYIAAVEAGGMYEKSAPSSTADRQCAALSVCHADATEFVAPATGAEGQKVRDRVCRCNAGFWGDGVSCAPIQECAETGAQEMTAPTDYVTEACVATSVGTDDQACADADISGGATASQSACEGAGTCTYPAGVTATVNRVCQCVVVGGTTYLGDGFTCLAEVSGCTFRTCVATESGTDDAPCAAADVTGDEDSSRTNCEAAGECTFDPEVQYQKSAQTPTAPRVCEAISDCVAGTQYQTALPGGIRGLVWSNNMFSADRDCSNCTAVANAAVGSTLTCTSPTDSRIVLPDGQTDKCQPGYGFFGTATASDADDECTACNTMAPVNESCVPSACPTFAAGTTGAQQICEQTADGATGCTYTAPVTEVTEACVDTDSSGDDCAFTAGDPSSCGTGCDYTAPVAAVAEGCAAPTCSFTAGDASSCTGTAGCEYIAAVSGATVDSVASCTACTGPAVGDCTAAVCAAGYVPGTFAAGECTACTSVANIAADASVTCTTGSDSRVSACATGFFKTEGAAGAHDTCTACTPVQNAGDGTTLSCTTADNSRVDSCAAEHFKTVGADDSSHDTCTPLTACDTTTSEETTPGNATANRACGCLSGYHGGSEVEATFSCTACTPLLTGAADGATYTCTTAEDSRVSACAAGTFHTVGQGPNQADACTFCAYFRADSIDGGCTQCTGPAVADCTAATCSDGYVPGTFDASAGECTACPAVTDAAAGADYTCAAAVGDAAPVTRLVVPGDGSSPCNASNYHVPGADSSQPDACPACVSVANAEDGASYTCTGPSDSRVSGCAEGFSKVPGVDGAADQCLEAAATCEPVANAAEGATLTCTGETDSRVSACAPGFFKTEGAAGAHDTCTACTPVQNAGDGTTLSCTTADNSRVDSCAAEHFKTVGADDSSHDTCTPLTACGANAEETTPGTATANRVCGCTSGNYELTDGGATFGDCAPWTPCGDGMTVSITGTATKDQVCGLKVVAATSLPGAVSDIDAFKTQIAAAADATDDVVVEVTSFEQKIESSAVMPGTAADYSDAAAEEQFKAGVAAALGTDPASITNFLATDSRRRLQSRRQLQATVSITYDVTTTDPAAAAAVATAATGTSFAQALAQAVNEAGTALTPINPLEVTVYDPVTTTEIQYAIVVVTADPSAASGVQANLADTSALATALASAVQVNAGVTLSSLTASAVVACQRPADAGYLFVETSLDPAAFAVTALCNAAAGYGGSSPSVAVCASGGNPYVPSGCEAIVCTRPSDVTGYTITAEPNLDLSQGALAVTAACDTTTADSPGGFQGTAVATACTSPETPYTLSGCSPAPVVCTTPSDLTGYDEDQLVEVDLTAAGFTVNAACDADGTATQPWISACLQPVY